MEGRHRDVAYQRVTAGAILRIAMSSGWTLRRPAGGANAH